ncbi:MAG TPA: NAD-dependent DNA ligase LigA, partial [Patescibacteria group bacterium]|nr:NAD-dependent DNA ligase LigA [Patescibacteria group bacterium]
RKLGFCTDAHAAVCHSLEDVLGFYEHIKKKRDQFPYQMDGVVVRVDSNELFDRLGVVGKAPRGALALKFPAEQATTVVENIQVQIGRTGALTPVAHLRPVQVAGSTVQRATLHNMDEIKRLDVRIGDTVIIEKAGDIIPDIVQVLPNLRTGKEKIFRMPKQCPSCHSSIVKKEGEVAYYCSNKNCFGQQREHLYHFVSKKQCNIDGLGPKIIDQLFDAGLVTTAADIFNLQESDLNILERFAEKSAHNIIVAIQSAKHILLARLIAALGIRHVGEQTAIALSEHFGSFEKLRHATYEEVDSIPDIGEASGRSIISYFADPKNQEYLDALLSHLTIENPNPKQHALLTGKTFLFTGTLHSLARSEAEEKVRELGGQVHASVTKSLNYLVAGKNPGSKLEKAQKNQVTILNEQQFLKMISSLFRKR